MASQPSRSGSRDQTNPAPACSVRVRFYADGGSGDNPPYPLADLTRDPAVKGQKATDSIRIAEGDRRATAARLRVVNDDEPEDEETILVGLQGAAAKRPRRRGSGRRVRKRRQLRRLAVLIAAEPWSCDGAGLVGPPAAADVPEPGTLAVAWTAPAGRPAPAGAFVKIDGPGGGDARTPGLEPYESERHGPRRFVIAGDLADGLVLEFRVPDRRQARLYSVRVVEVAGEDRRRLEPDEYRAAIASH